MRSILLLTAFLSTLATVALGQEKSLEGLGVFKKYDKSYATPELRRQPGISLGYNAVNHTPFVPFFGDGWQLNSGFRISYNHMYSRRGGLRRRLENQIFRERFQFGFGGTLQMDFTNEGHKFGALYGYFYRPIIRINLGVVKFSFINEYGLGVGWRPRELYSNAKTISPVVSIEGFRLQLLQLPVMLTASTLYSLRNNVFGKDPLDISILFSARIYFYDYSDKKK